MIPTNRQIHIKLYIGRPDGLTWEDVTDYLESARVSVNVDDIVRQMQFTLRNDGSMQPAWAETIARPDTDIVGSDTTVIGTSADSAARLINLLFNTTNKYARNSFAPRDQTSTWNWFSGVYAPLLWPNREVMLRVAITVPGVEPVPADWVTLFHGLLGDEISTGGPTVTCLARDLAKRLMDCYIEEPRQYGSDAGVPAEDVMQAILNDNLGASAPTLYCPVSPGFMLKPYTVEYQSVWDALKAIAQQIGWCIGYRWDPVTSAYRLTFFEPPRNKTTPDFVLDYMDDILRHDLAVNDAGIRNAVKVTYRDAATGERRSVIVEDTASIAAYGRRAMQIEESDTSLIDTEAEALTMANAILADLSQISTRAQIEMPLMPQIDLFTAVSIHDPRVSSTDEFFGVEQVNHLLDAGQGRYRTTVIGNGRVIGAYSTWLDMQTRPGANEPGSPADHYDQIAPDPPRNLTGTFTGLDAIISWSRPTEPDYVSTLVEVYVSGVRVREEYTAEDYYVYTFAKNIEDNITPQALITVRLYHEDAARQRSLASEVVVQNPAPTAPIGLNVVSTLSHIQIRVADPQLADLDYVEVQLALHPDYTDAITVYRGSSFEGINVPCKGPGINYVRVRFIDKFGQSSQWAASSTDAKLIGRADFAGDLFQITPSATPAPSSGNLASLWDADTTTGVTFSAAPTIEFAYPMQWFFDMVRLYTPDAVSYYVQAYDMGAGQWVDVIGSAAAPVAANPGQWTVRRFDNNRMIATDKIRIVFMGPLTLTELKFWTITFADEILAQQIQAWQINTSSIMVSSLGDGASYPMAVNAKTETLFRFSGGLYSTRGLKATFNRASQAYTLDGKLVDVGVPRYSQGKFGQAVLVEEGTTNLAPPGAEDFSIQHGWQVVGGATITVTPGQPDPFGGNNAYRIQSSGGSSVVKYQLPVLGRPNPHTDTVSCWIKVLSGNATFGLARLQVVATNQWQRLTDRIVDFATSNTTIYLGCNQATDTLDILVYGPQIENKPHATSYIMPGSTRSPETLTIPTAGVLSAQEGAITCVITPLVVQNYNNFFLSTVDTGRFLLYFRADGKVGFDFGAADTGPISAAGLAVAGKPLHVGMRWSSADGTYSLVVDGQLIGTVPFTAPTSLPSTLSVVNNYGALVEALDLSLRALTVAELIERTKITTPPVDPSGIVDADGSPVVAARGSVSISADGVVIHNGMLYVAGHITEVAGQNVVSAKDWPLTNNPDGLTEKPVRITGNYGLEVWNGGLTVYKDAGPTKLIDGGVVQPDGIVGLPGDKISSGTVDLARLPSHLIRTAAGIDGVVQYWGGPVTIPVGGTVQISFTQAMPYVPTIYWLLPSSWENCAAWNVTTTGFTIKNTSTVESRTVNWLALSASGSVGNATCATCYSSCQTTCQRSCQTTCELSCQLACETSACQTACQASCQDACLLTTQTCSISFYTAPA